MVKDIDEHWQEEKEVGKFNVEKKDGFRVEFDQLLALLLQCWITCSHLNLQVCLFVRILNFYMTSDGLILCVYTIHCSHYPWYPLGKFSQHTHT